MDLLSLAQFLLFKQEVYAYFGNFGLYFNSDKAKVVGPFSQICPHNDVQIEFLLKHPKVGGFYLQVK